jgi:hypothetical protein
MKTLICLISFFAVTVSQAQVDVTLPRLTHLLKETNQATFDHGQIAQPGEALTITHFYSNMYFAVKYKGGDYFVYYPYIHELDSYEHIVANVELKEVHRPHISSQSTNTGSYQSGSSGSDRVIHTGPKGGRYYINKNGNKTYVKKGS